MQPSRIDRINRAHLTVALAAFALVSAVEPRDPPIQTSANRDSALASAREIADDERTAAATRVAAQLRRVNPSLTESQLARIGTAVSRSSVRHGLEPDLVTAMIVVESGARPWARSPKGAVGLMQLMPHMYVPLDLAGNATTIESNIEAGCVILADNIRRLGEENGILSYFWGSDIRGVAYLDRVQEARESLRTPAES